MSLQKLCRIEFSFLISRQKRVGNFVDDVLSGMEFFGIWKYGWAGGGGTNACDL